jgi:GT2 family glycosyltransferase
MKTSKNTGATRISVVILTYEQREMTLECLEHVLAMEGAPFDVVVWDNGSHDGTVKAITERYPQVLAHLNPDNLGVASGRNAGAALAFDRFDPTHVLFLDNDIEVEPQFLAALLDGFDEDTNVGQTQAKLRFYDERNRLNDGGGCQISFWRGTTIPVGFDEVDEGQWDQRRDCISCGGAMLTRADLFRELGGFDSKYDPYAKYKARNWFTFLLRHAPLHQKLGFFFLSAPALVLRLIVREGRQGNFGAIRGMLRGVVDIARGGRARQ